ncbi:hypothetical protein [Tautonia plasticadhaerens]|uniref:Uncharacterized protein n=1 Tax=Tautonia plasticadhaerens TaxID=2527974 RepID=A0A518H273_9BACT|nr:hypothetical protein [Tautonia plasticadhaerens]QDV34946.1 hypothetical protein ElP_28430 [Tautonia plasticadhaerens]
MTQEAIVDEMHRASRSVLPATGGQETVVPQDFAAWLNGKLTEWCRARGYSPVHQGDLFKIVDEAKRFATSAVIADRPQTWECFCDIAYYDQWAVRPVGENRWGYCFHVPSRKEAEALRDLLQGTASPFSAIDAQEGA